MPIREIEKIAADFHVHTVASDGTNTIMEVLSMARAMKLSAFSITDHDSIGAFTNPDFLKLLEEHNLELSAPHYDFNGLKIVTGIEFSTADIPQKGFKDVHIVGLGLDVTNPELASTLTKLADARLSQKVESVKIMSEKFGFDITFEEVAARSSGNIGKPHIVETILEKAGYSATSTPADEMEKRLTMKDELYRLLDGPAKIEKGFILEIKETIDLIHRCGGIAILAHPGLHNADEAIVRECAQMGVDGVEVYYAYDFSPFFPDVRPETSGPLISRYLQLANETGLMISGGSDYHGSIKAIDIAEAGVDEKGMSIIMSAIDAARSGYNPS
ncbi:MAG: hypothetical protein CVV64_19910 [Candidatus Wallbacteria bacterium HGW-Wallbacteria-1]|uniref:Polymerase/histidinol phosphatase N-terminal domain-containing protein n=1 Tax=Candidatus Wallbacteria bacterium HGW-Wallbacteria-1 TaxID=2013854 RepID=A0A2N1PIM7_9BACT|nr:MAG: hypothetical protein CVV64_19910 [Candidatus Wallbacteria bacterium HGW-Wallbacteria-1]